MAIVRLVAAMGPLLLVAAFPAQGSNASERPSMAAAPRAHCGPGAQPETAAQGRVPASDYTSGRAAQGYTCNTREVGHYGQTGGLKVFRFVDNAGHTCAFYDSTTFFPTDALTNLTKDGLGVVVLDMSDPTHPNKVANLTSPAMLTPHESLVLNDKRGLLVAVAGNAVTYPGVVDVYDVKQNCLAPKLLSTSATGVLGHESAFSADGRTFYASSTVGGTLAAVDLSDPTNPKTLFYEVGAYYHGMRVSADGNRLYVAYIGQPAIAFADRGLQILDVSEIQARKPNPQAPVISDLTWPSKSTPQIPIPITIGKHKYLLEVDEFASTGPAPEVGAARIINIDNDRRPTLVSNIRLQVHQPDDFKGPQQNDPGAADPQFGGYTAHYCSVPRPDNPTLAACSFIASGLRIFDLRDPKAPREVAYFNRPPSRGARAMSAPAWDLQHDQVWYSDANGGFYAVQLTNGVGSLLHLRTKSPPGAKAG